MLTVGYLVQQSLDQAAFDQWQRGERNLDDDLILMDEAEAKIAKAERATFRSHELGRLYDIAFRQSHRVEALEKRDQKIREAKALARAQANLLKRRRDVEARQAAQRALDRAETLAAMRLRDFEANARAKRLAARETAIAEMEQGRITRAGIMAKAADAKIAELNWLRIDRARERAMIRDTPSEMFKGIVRRVQVPKMGDRR